MHAIRSAAGLWRTLVLPAFVATCVSVAVHCRHLSAAEPPTIDQQLALGKDLFTRVWQSQPTDVQGDGLGPLFNERSCAACHKLGGLGGGGPRQNNVQIVNVGPAQPTPFFRDQKLRDEAYEAQRRYFFPALEAGKNSLVLHRFGVDRRYDAWRDHRLAFIEPAVYARNDFITSAQVKLLAKLGVSSGSEMILPMSLEERNTTALFGAGLIDEIPVATLQEVAASQAREVRGRPAMFPDGRVGRFGWKAQNTSLIDFNENACAVELGLETPNRREAKLPLLPRAPARMQLAEFRDSPGLDMSAAEVAALSRYVGSLPQPRQVIAPEKADDVHAGERVFEKVGCATCHRPQLAHVQGIYSDLLLHRMDGTGAVYYGPTESPSGDIVSVPPAADEFRTPPLWGVADSAPYMHDGSAKTLIDAVLAHGNQGAAAGQRFRSLQRKDQLRLVAFLESLRAPTSEMNVVAGLTYTQ